MTYRRLRIAWSVAWGIFAVLLCVLCVWSYWYSETVERGSSQRFITVSSTLGRLYIWYDGDASQIFWPGGPQWNFYEGRTTIPGSGSFVGGGQAYFVIPHLAIAIGSIGLGYMPWLTWSLRFSLRTLLIVTTLVAVVLGLVMWTAN